MRNILQENYIFPCYPAKAKIMDAFKLPGGCWLFVGSKDELNSNANQIRMKQLFCNNETE